jgi:HK97 family phage portal protein
MSRWSKAWAALRGAEPETRSLPAVSHWTGNVGSGHVISPHTAENLSLVASAVSAISSAMASLPAWCYRAADGGRVVDQQHPLARLIDQGPNDKQTWPDWLEWTMASVLLRGNALSEVVRDATGAVEALLPVPWSNVSVQMLPSGRLAFDVVRVTDAWGGTGRPRRLLEGEVFYLKDRSDDGLVGRSRLSRSAAVIDAALSVQEFAGAMYTNQATPKGVLSFKSKLSPDALSRVQAMWQSLFAGPSRAAKTLVLDQDGEFKPISVSPEDAELLASRRFTAEEIARLFNVPPPLCGIWEFSSFTNSETAGRWFAQFCLAPWCRKVEAEARRSIFTADERASHHLEIDLSGMTRGDYEARWKAHEIGVKNGILTVNEAREIEGFNPRPDGDAPAVAAA